MSLTTSDDNANTVSPIQQFFAGTTIFLTGATGFMGKCLLEKLLRSCSDIEKIYILVRDKKGKDAVTRVEELFQDVVFSKLKEKSDKFHSKVIPIAGDVSSQGLGISLYDRQLLQREVDVVFHVAATVNFNEKLKLSAAINLNGTKEMLELCKEMENLKSMVHVSTAYSNCHLDQIDEKFYHYPMSPKQLTAMIDELDDQTVETITPQILGHWPNTYAFTKAMAENYIYENRVSMPVAVFRPAVVVSTWKEPIQGWIDNVYGPTGICAGALMGVLGSLWCDENIFANIVPVDMTINALISCAWDTAIQHSIGQKMCLTKTLLLKEDDKQKSNKYLECGDDKDIGTVYQTSNLYMQVEQKENETEIDPCVYNYVSTVEKPLTWGEYCGINVMYGKRYPLKNAIWCVKFNITKNYGLHTFYMIFLHLLPAILVDSLFVVLGKQPRLLKIYKQTEKFANIISYFCNKEWTFSNNNVQRLWVNLDPRDKQIFPFSMKDMNWLDYFRTYMQGMRKYLCKNDETTIPEAITKQSRDRKSVV